MILIRSELEAQTILPIKEESLSLHWGCLRNFFNTVSNDTTNPITGLQPELFWLCTPEKPDTRSQPLSYAISSNVSLIPDGLATPPWKQWLDCVRSWLEMAFLFYVPLFETLSGHLDVCRANISTYWKELMVFADEFHEISNFVNLYSNSVDFVPI